MHLLEMRFNILQFKHFNLISLRNFMLNTSVTISTINRQWCHNINCLTKRVTWRLYQVIKPFPSNIDIHILPSKTVKSSQTGEKFIIQGNFNCFTEGVIYVTACDKCKKQYIGQTGRTLYERVREHMYDLKKGKNVSGIQRSYRATWRSFY